MTDGLDKASVPFSSPPGTGGPAGPSTDQSNQEALNDRPVDGPQSLFPPPRRRSRSPYDEGVDE